MSTTDDNIFEALKKGHSIASDHEELHLLRAASYETIALVQQLNHTADPAAIRDLLSKVTGTAVDESVAVFPPIYINYGKHLTIGRNVFINFDCTLLTLGGVIIEDNVLIGPNVKILSEGHPLDPSERHSLIPGKVHIGQNAWIGAGATILPGITIGENAVIAAGAMVTNDVAANTVVAGIPAKIVRTI